MHRLLNPFLSKRLMAFSVLRNLSNICFLFFSREPNVWFVSLMLVRACRCWPELASEFAGKNPGLELSVLCRQPRISFLIDSISQKAFFL